MTEQPEPPAASPDDEHVCKPGASVYYCPTAGETESDCHGGFDVCCGRPDLHQQLVPCSTASLRRQPHAAHSWEPQPGMIPVHCEGVRDDRAVPAPPVPGLRDQLCDAFIRLIRDYADRSIIAPGYMADAVLAVVQPVIDEVDLLRRGATERADLLEEARDALSAAGQNGAHGDDWPNIAPSIRALGERARKAERAANLLAGSHRRAEQAEAALARVREACDQLQRASVLADGQPHADREHGVVQAVTRVLRAFTPPVPADGPEERS